MIALVKRWREGLIGLLLLSCAAAWAGKALADRKAEALQAKLTLALGTLERERDATVAATAVAKAQDAAHAARVERDQARITQEVENAYQMELAELRRRYDAVRLRNGSAADDSGRGGSTSMPGFSSSSGRADGSSGEARLSAERLGLDPVDALVASEQALRLKALQQWVRAQSKVEP